jgi:hypothetical protein
MIILAVAPWTTLLAALVGGLLSLTGVFGIEIFRDCWQTRNLKSAFVGELRALLLAVDGANLFATLEEVIRLIEANQAPAFSNQRVAGELHNLVFRANADKLGKLAAPLPERLALAHSEVGGIVHDLNYLTDIAEGRAGVTSNAIRTDWQRCLRYHRNVLNRARRTRELLCS